MTTDETPMATAQPARSGIGLRMLLAFALLAFVGGAMLAAWLAVNWKPQLRSDTADAVSSGSAAADGAPVGNVAAAPPAAMMAAGQGGGARVEQVAELEERLARISIAAQAASHNANRAEAILTAFAARRALDAGRPLGYVESALRLRFGEAQPKAVATIVNAAASPVTLADLRLNLQDIVVQSAAAKADSDWWRSFWREVQGIAVIRRAGTPPPEPEQRIQRAIRAVDAGHVDVAIRELTALPGQPQLTRWLELARRYNEAHRALDVVEAAAILEPRTAQGMDIIPVEADADARAAENAAAPVSVPALQDDPARR